MFSAARASFDSVRGASALSADSAANSETGSVTGAQSNCSKPSLGVADMAERACMSRLDHSRKERRVWRDEVVSRPVRERG
jgi:hypothetical protein